MAEKILLIITKTFWFVAWVVVLLAYLLAGVIFSPLLLLKLFVDEENGSE